MGTFLKENGYSMVKLFVNQIGLTVFGTMLTLATTKNPPLQLAASIFSVLFFLVVNYTSLWEIGAKDKIRIDGGRLKPMPSKGFLLALGSNIPNYLLTMLLGIGLLINTAFGQSMSLISNIIIKLLNGMYLGIINSVQTALYGTPQAELSKTWWIYLIITVPSLIVGWLAYFLGSKNFRISSIFGIKLKPSGTNKKN